MRGSESVNFATSTSYAAFVCGLWLGCRANPPEVPVRVCQPGPCTCDADACVCPDSGDCEIDCVGDCSMKCEGAQACDFVCAGPSCFVECTGSELCDVTIEVRGEVRSSGSGDCEITCTGPCRRVRGSGFCGLACSPDDPGETLMPSECTDGRTACGPCPDA